MFRRRQISKQAAPGAAVAEAKAAEPVSLASIAAVLPTSSTETAPVRKVSFCLEAEIIEPAPTPPKQPSRMFKVRRKTSKRAASPDSTASTEASDSSPWSSESDELPEPEHEGKFLDDFSTARKVVDALPRKAMIWIMRDLLDVYSSARFQDSLQKIDALEDGRRAELLRTSHRGVLNEHRLPEGEAGEIALVYLVSLFNTRNDEEGMVLVNQIDYALFGQSCSSNTNHLGKSEVVDVLRSQIRTFASEEFQSKLALLLEGVKSGDSKEPPKMHESGLPMCIFHHALSKQKPFLDRYGLPPDESGLVQLNFDIALQIGDPIVAKGVSIASALMGMDEATIASFGERSIATALTDKFGKHFGGS